MYPLKGLYRGEKGNVVKRCYMGLFLGDIGFGVLGLGFRTLCTDTVKENGNYYLGFWVCGCRNLGLVHSQGLRNRV